MQHSLVETIVRAMYGRSSNPEAPENYDLDFQLGYLAGKQSRMDSLDLITAEWKNRGEPKVVTESFKNWKAGLWAARFEAAVELMHQH